MIGSILRELFSGSGSSSSSSSSDAAPSREPDPREYVSRSRPATTIYDGDRESTYVRPYGFDADGQIVRMHETRAAEVRTSAFLALNEEVVSHDANANVFFGHFLMGAGWERFYEPNHKAGSIDTLDTFRFRLGPNVLGPSVPMLELYTLVGASALSGFGETIPAFDLALEARAYPVRPLAFTASGTTSFFKNGPPIIEGRLEGGVSLGRFDLRAGFRALRQNPEQSFVGPVASIALRL